MRDDVSLENSSGSDKKRIDSRHVKETESVTFNDWLWVVREEEESSINPVSGIDDGIKFYVCK